MQINSIKPLPDATSEDKRFLHGMNVNTL